MVIPSTIECGADAGVFPSTLIGYGAGCGPNVQPCIRLACRVLSSLYKPLQYYIAIDSASFTFPLPFLLVLLFWARLSRFESAIRVRPLFSSPLDQGQRQSCRSAWVRLQRSRPSFATSGARDHHGTSHRLFCALNDLHEQAKAVSSTQSEKWTSDITAGRIKAYAKLNNAVPRHANASGKGF